MGGREEKEGTRAIISARKEGWGRARETDREKGQEEGLKLLIITQKVIKLTLRLISGYVLRMLLTVIGIMEFKERNAVGKMY